MCVSSLARTKCGLTWVFPELECFAVQWKRLSSILMIASLVMVVAGFFLPWIKARAGFSAAREKISEAFHQQTDPGLGWEDFVCVDEVQQRAALRDPFKGLTGFRLAEDLRHDRKTALLSRHFAERLLPGFSAVQRGWVLVGFTVVAMGMAAALLYWQGGEAFLIWGGCVLMTLYAVARWRLALTEGGWLLLDIHIGLGLWLWVYGLALLALGCWVRAIFPRVRWI